MRCREAPSPVDDAVYPEIADLHGVTVLPPFTGPVFERKGAFRSNHLARSPGLEVLRCRWPLRDACG